MSEQLLAGIDTTVTGTNCRCAGNSSASGLYKSLSALAGIITQTRNHATGSYSPAGDTR